MYHRFQRLMSVNGDSPAHADYYGGSASRAWQVAIPDDGSDFEAYYEKAVEGITPALKGQGVEFAYVTIRREIGGYAESDLGKPFIVVMFYEVFAP